MYVCIYRYVNACIHMYVITWPNCVFLWFKHNYINNLYYIKIILIKSIYTIDIVSAIYVSIHLIKRNTRRANK